MVGQQLRIELCKAKRFWPLCLLAFLSACVNDMNEVAAIIEPMTLPVVEEVNAELIYTDSAQLKVLVEAPILHHYAGEDPYLELTKGVHVTFSIPREELSLRLQRIMPFHLRKKM
jgi:hypothetical protein